MPRLIFSFLASILLSASAHADDISVVTDIPVVASLTEQVMGNTGAPDILVGAGQDLHHVQLRPSQARLLAKADLILWAGAALTPWLADAIENLAQPGAAVSLIDAHVGDSHGHDNPHVWLDPLQALAWIDTIAEALSAQDPGNAAIYSANATDARARINQLHADMAEILQPALGIQLVLQHDAYGHLAERFGLTIAGAVTGPHAQDSGAGGIVGLRDISLSAGAVCLIAEADHDPSLLESLNPDGKLPMVIVDPEGNSIPHGPSLYEDLMRDLATAIASCAKPH